MAAPHEPRSSSREDGSLWVTELHHASMAVLQMGTLRPQEVKGWVRSMGFGAG